MSKPIGKPTYEELDELMKHAGSARAWLCKMRKALQDGNFEVPKSLNNVIDGLRDSLMAVAVSMDGGRGKFDGLQRHEDPGDELAFLEDSEDA